MREQLQAAALDCSTMCFRGMAQRAASMAFYIAGQFRRLRHYPGSASTGRRLISPNASGSHDVNTSSRSVLGTPRITQRPSQRRDLRSRSARLPIETRLPRSDKPPRPGPPLRPVPPPKAAPTIAWSLFVRMNCIPVVSLAGRSDFGEITLRLLFAGTGRILTARRPGRRRSSIGGIPIRLLLPPNLRRRRLSR